MSLGIPSRTIETDQEPRRLLLKRGENLWNYKEKIQAKIRQIEDDGDLSETRIQTLLGAIDQIEHILTILDTSEVPTPQNSTLRHLQRLSLIGYIDFIIESLSGEVQTGFILAPTWQGKTRIALLIAKTCPRKTLIICDGNTGVKQFYDEWCQMWIESIVGKVSEDFSGWATQIHITNWQQLSIGLSSGAIKASDYGQILVDEVDINGLSPDRVELLGKWSREHNSRITGLSATEYQGSGKQVSHFYKYDILNFPMPESLPEIFERGELPWGTFQDRSISLVMNIGEEDREEIQESTVNRFIRSSSWIDEIFAYHTKQNAWRKFILGMRDNKLNDFIIEKAAKHGIRLRALTGEMNLDERSEVISALKAGTIDGIVGSRLSWRWLDIPECDVVYSSLLTFSPQIFWQLMGRALRMDPANPEKRVDIVNFLPSSINLETHEVSKSEGDEVGGSIETSVVNVTQYKIPLSFQAFLDPKYFSQAPSAEKWSKVGVFRKNIEDLTQKDIASIGEVMSLMKAKNLYGNFTGRPELLGNIIRRMPFISMNNLLKFILSLKGSAAKQFLERAAEIPRREYRYKELIARYPIPQKPLTLDYERDLIAKYLLASWEKKKQLRDTIISYHYPIIVSLALVLEEQWVGTLDDLIQVWVESLLKRFDNLYVWTRFSGFCAVSALAGMLKYSGTEESTVYIPSNVALVVKKVIKLLEWPNPENLSDNELIDNYLKSTEKTKSESKIQAKRRIILRIIALMQMETLPDIETLDTDATLGLYREGPHEDPIETVMRTQDKRLIDELIGSLNPQEARVIRLRFGINIEEHLPQRDDLTLEEVGSIFWVTRERIRQIEWRAIRKLKGRPMTYELNQIWK